MDNKTLKRIADNIRVLSVAMPEKAKSGHPGGPMGGADFMALLYTEFLSYDPDDLAWRHRHRRRARAGARRSARGADRCRRRRDRALEAARAEPVKGELRRTSCC